MKATRIDGPVITNSGTAGELSPIGNAASIRECARPARIGLAVEDELRKVSRMADRRSTAVAYSSR